MAKPAAPTVTAYIAVAPAPMRAILKHFRAAIKSAVPKAEESIKYRIPCYMQDGYLVAFAVFAKHCSLVIMREGILNEFKKELAGFTISGTTIHCKPGQLIPKTLITKMVQLRVKQNAARAALKKKQSK